MKRTTWFLLAAGLGVTSCRAEHLGRNTGEAYREALSAQRTSDDDDDEVPALDAEDAFNVLERHHAPPAKADGSASATSVTTTSSSAGGGTDSGMWQGASGNISIEAK